MLIEVRLKSGHALGHKPRDFPGNGIPLLWIFI